MTGARVPMPLSEARRDVLYALRRRGEATVEQLAGALGMSVSGARQHLRSLEEASLVVARPESSPGRGRPAFVYRVSAEADGLFPKAYGQLTNELLGYLDPDLEASLFDRRRDQRIEHARQRLAGKDLEGRVAELAAILDGDGYLATWDATDDGSYVIVERNCAIAAVAQAHPGACRSELEFISAVLPDADVTRTHHMVQGETHCGYQVVPRPVDRRRAIPA